MRRGVFVVSVMAVLGLWLAGCRIVVSFDAVRVFRAERLEPEGWYKTLFEEMEKCTGKSKDYGALDWYIVERGRMGTIEGDEGTELVVGLFSPPTRIYLSEDRVMDHRIIGHEMLHYLTGEYDTPLFDEILRACGLT